MKTAFCLIAGAAALFCTSSFAGSPARPAPQWNVRIEVLIVDVPQAKALALLPALRDPGKIDGAVKQIFTAIGNGDANLIGYPAVQTLDGERAVAETVIEKRYPTGFQPRDKPQPAPSSALPPPPPPPGAAPFETRNTGVTLEVEPQVLQNGDWIRINLVPQRVVFLGMDRYHPGVDQPRFFTAKTTTSIAVRNGQQCLLAVHKLPDNGGPVELFILQAWDMPIK